jgi:hypothetical protein
MFLGSRGTDETWKAGGKGEDQRAHPRMDLRTFATIRYGEKEASCKLHDISLGGMCFVAPWPVQVDEVVHLKLDPPQGILGTKTPKHAATMKARICRVSAVRGQKGRFKVGAKFLALTVEGELMLRMWFHSFAVSPEREPRRTAV